MYYNPALLPENISEKELYIAYWTGSEWSAFDSTVDTEVKMVSAEITHFTEFALIGKPPTLPPEETKPPTTTRPAAFEVSDLTVTPEEAEPREKFTVSMVVKNTGGRRGSYTVALKINNVEEAREEITLAANDSETVTFDVSRDISGTCEISVDDQVCQLTIIEPDEPSPSKITTSWGAWAAPSQKWSPNTVQHACTA